MEGERSHIGGRYCSVCGRRISVSDGDRYTCNNCKKEENKIMKRIITPFVNGKFKLEFGDYILFQEYEQGEHDGEEYNYNVTKPILAIYLGCFVADQTLGFNYVRWNNENHLVYVTNEHVTRYALNKQVNEIEHHIEWDDYIDILGHWKNKPNWKEIIVAYRKQNTKEEVNSIEIDWENLR